MTTKLITWDNDAPATPEILGPLFDNMGLGKDDKMRSERPEQKERAREASINYFTDVINNEDGMSMGEVNVQGYVFYDGYLAGLANKVHPERC